jgi:quinol monooxygenase YgiN
MADAAAPQLVVLGCFDFHPDDAAAAAALMRAMTEATLREPGCAHYAFSADLAVPGRFHLSELWLDAPALDAHALTAHMAAFRAGLARLRVQSRSVTRYAVSAPSEL